MRRVDSVEYFSPSFHSKKRLGSMLSAVFNLSSTILGGGTLSLPYAFNNSGLLMGCIFQVVVAVASGFSMYIIMSCARRSGATTYEDVAALAFGEKARVCFSLSLSFSLSLCMYVYVIAFTYIFISPYIPFILFYIIIIMIMMYISMYKTYHS